MTLSAKRQLFTIWVSRLIDIAVDSGYGVALAEVQRGEQQAKWNATHCAHRKGRVRCEKNSMAREHAAFGHEFRPIGILNSLHRIGLAADLLLYSDGKYLRNSEDYRPLGEWWEAQQEPGIEFCWGGHFGDGGHFSFAHGGRK